MNRTKVNSEDPPTHETHGLPAAAPSWDVQWPSSTMTDDITPSYWPGAWQADPKVKSGKSVSMSIVVSSAFKAYEPSLIHALKEISYTVLVYL